MFGYVRVRRSELRVREYEYYQSIYCGLCRRMGQCTGQCSRLSLSYDLAYLALLRMALTGEKTVIRERRCIAHPFHKRKMMEPGDALTYAARVSALLTYEKCRDDVADSRGFRRLRARFRAAFFIAPTGKPKKFCRKSPGRSARRSLNCGCWKAKKALGGGARRRFCPVAGENLCLWPFGEYGGHSRRHGPGNRPLHLYNRRAG